jgi:hypothetical protein
MKRFFSNLMIAVTIGISGLSAAIVLTPTPVYAACESVTLSSPLINGQSAVTCGQHGIIFSYLKMIIQFLSGAVGLVVVLLIVIGGVQYITSAGDPAGVKAAKSRITNAITGLVLFLLMFAILNFLIPGGIIGA